MLMRPLEEVAVLILQTPRTTAKPSTSTCNTHSRSEMTCSSNGRAASSVEPLPHTLTVVCAQQGSVFAKVLKALEGAQKEPKAPLSDMFTDGKPVPCCVLRHISYELVQQHLCLVV